MVIAKTKIGKNKIRWTPVIPAKILAAADRRRGGSQHTFSIRPQMAESDAKINPTGLGPSPQTDEKRSVNRENTRSGAGNERPIKNFV